MRIKSSIGLAVGPVNASHWGQVLVSPTAYGIIEIQDSMGAAQQLGVQALSLLGQKLSSGVASLKMLEEVADSVNGTHVVSLVLLVPVGSVVYVVLRGTASVYVKRGSELASLMHEDGGVSGEVREGDVFLLASRGFSQVLSHAELAMLFDHLAPPDVAEKLTILLHEKQGGEGSVALVFGAMRLEENESAPDPETEDKEIEEPELPNPTKPSFFVAFRDRIVHGMKRYTVHDFIHRGFGSFRDHPRKTKAVLVAVLIILFLSSVLLGIQKQVTSKKNQAVVSAMNNAQHSLDEGIALLSLNPVKARQRLNDAKSSLDPFIHSVSLQTPDGYALNQLYRKVTDNLTQALHSVNIPLAPFYDMSLLKKGAAASFIAVDGDTAVIGDATTATVFTLAIPSKNAHIVGGGNTIKNLLSVAIHGSTVYALTGDGIVSYNTTDSTSLRVVKKSDSWGLVSSLVSFGGNLYVLDMQKSRVWKYVATDTGFSDLREYLNPDTLPDFSQATNMSIDGSVWIGTTKGSVMRFTQGKENPYSPQGLDTPLGSNIRVFTSDSAKNVYLLDSQNDRVVVLDKDGIYLAQYHFSGGTVRDFIVSEQNKKILLLVDGKIYSIDLN